MSGGRRRLAAVLQKGNAAAVLPHWTGYAAIHADSGSPLSLASSVPSTTTMPPAMPPTARRAGGSEEGLARTAGTMLLDAAFPGCRSQGTQGLAAGLWIPLPPLPMPESVHPAHCLARLGSWLPRRRLRPPLTRREPPTRRGAGAADVLDGDLAAAAAVAARGCGVITSPASVSAVASLTYSCLMDHTIR